MHTTFLWVNAHPWLHKLCYSLTIHSLLIATRFIFHLVLICFSWKVVGKGEYLRTSKANARKYLNYQCRWKFCLIKENYQAWANIFARGWSYMYGVTYILRGNKIRRLGIIVVPTRYNSCTNTQFFFTLILDLMIYG